MAYSPVTHVLFDMDGLILNTEELYTNVFQNIVSRYGKDYTWELKSRLMGTQSLETAKIIVAELNLPMTPEEFIVESTKVMKTLFPDAEVMPDTEELYTNVFQNIVSRYGKDYTWELKSRLMGTQSLETAKIIVAELNLPMTPEEFIVESTKVMKTLFPDAEVMPGAKRLIEHLHKHKIPIGLATSSSIESYELKIMKHHQQLFSLFPYKTFGSSDPEVKRGKPYPDIFLVAAQKFPDKPKPEKCLVFEDALNGVRAARAAGMQVVMVPDKRVEKALLAEATQALSSLEDFKPELFGLPPFED